MDIRQKKDWFRSDRDYFWILALGSFHPNGYYRQACLEEMAGYPGALPFLVLRLNDWVGEVRLLLPVQQPNVWRHVLWMKCLRP